MLRFSVLGCFFLMRKSEASSQISHRPTLGCRYMVMFCCEKDDDSAVPFLSLAVEGGAILGSIWLPSVHSVSLCLYLLRQWSTSTSSVCFIHFHSLGITSDHLGAVISSRGLKFTSLCTHVDSLCCLNPEEPVIKAFLPCRGFKVQLQIPHGSLIHPRGIRVSADTELRAGPELQAEHFILKQDLGVAGRACSDKTASNLSQNI